MENFSKIVLEEWGGITSLKLQSRQANTWFSIIPDRGGCLNSYVHKGTDILLSATNEKEYQELTVNAFAGAQLFPFPNRIRNGEYKYDDKVFSLPVNDFPRKNALHGLIYDRQFQIEDIDEKKGVVKLKYHYRRDFIGYPFDLMITNTYRLLDDSISITTSIQNLGHESVPVGHGWHPYFITPKKMDNCNLQISQVGYYVIDKDLIPTGELEKMIEFSNFHPIGSSVLNHCFVLEEGVSSKVKLEYPMNEKTIEIYTKGYPYMQVYIPPDRNCIAFEPCSCIPDAFNNQIGCNYLEPNQVWDLGLDIVIKC